MKPIRRGGLQLHPLQVCDRVDVVIKLPIPSGAEVRWCKHAASSKLGMLLGRRREHLGSKFRPLRVIENGVQLATANHSSQTIHFRLARSRHRLWTPFKFVLNGHGASNVRLWPNSAVPEPLDSGLPRFHRCRRSGQIGMDSVFRCGRNTQPHRTIGPPRSTASRIGSSKVAHRPAAQSRTATATRPVRCHPAHTPAVRGCNACATSSLPSVP